MKHPLHPLLLSSCVLAACGVDASCPAGSARLGDACLLGADATVPNVPNSPSEPAPCGDGEVAEGEACDDGNQLDGDGCSSACELEDPCAAAPCAPEPPVLRGAASMAPGRELWTWALESDAARVELRLDGAELPTPPEPRLSPPLTAGPHTLEARACNDAGCSPWVEHHTVAEAFGQTLPMGLTDTARTLARTSLGHPVAIGCESCLSDGDGAPLAPAAAGPALERALARGSDLVALAVASVGSELRVTQADTVDAKGLLRLADLLAQPALRDGDALVLLDVVENEPRLSDAVPPAELAVALREALAAAPTLARNGRPLLVRTSHRNRSYLSALREALAEAPELSPYVRYVLRDPEGPVEELYAPDALTHGSALVPELDFVDAVSFSYTAPALPNRITLSRRAGRAVIIEGVPGSDTRHGHALITALRDQADVLITRYPADRARGLVSLANHALYFDAYGLSKTGTSQSVWHDTQGSASATEVVQDLTGIAQPLGQRDPASGMLPPALAFATAPRAAIAAPVDALPPSPQSGPLVALFGELGTQWVWSDGRVLGTRPSAGKLSILDLAGGASAAPVIFEETDTVTPCGSTLSALLPRSTSHWLVLYYDGAWKLVLDGACAVEKPFSFGPAANSQAHASLGIGGYGSILTASTIARLPRSTTKTSP